MELLHETLENLRRAQEVGISQATISRATGLSQAGISKIVRGQSENPGIRTLWRINHYLKSAIPEKKRQMTRIVSLDAHSDNSRQESKL